MPVATDEAEIGISAAEARSRKEAVTDAAVGVRDFRNLQRRAA